jgi:hypothetical protein
MRRSEIGVAKRYRFEKLRKKVELADVIPTLAANSDERHTHFGVGQVRFAGKTAGQERERPCRSRRSNEIPTRHFY